MAFLRFLERFCFLETRRCKRFSVRSRLREIARVGNGNAIGVGVEGFHPHINANLTASGFMGNGSLCLDGKLDVVAISAFEEADPLDVRERKGFNRPFANQPHAPNAVPEGVV